MRQGTKSINSEMKQLRTSNDGLRINYARIIDKQQEVIKSLNEEILLLKSYITIPKMNAPSDIFCGENSTLSSISSHQNSLTKELQTSITHNYKHYQKIIRDIIDILELKEITELDDPLLLQGVRKIKDSSNRKQQPIFVERIKEIKVPITVQKIVQIPVEKIVQRIVYVERPVTKQKRQQRYMQKIDVDNEERSFVLNKTYSQKNLSKPSQPYHQQQIQGRYEQYKKSDVGGNLLKKRGDIRHAKKGYY